MDWQTHVVLSEKLLESCGFYKYFDNFGLIR